MKTFLKILALTVFLYLIGVFVAGTWDTSEWSTLGKLIYATLYVWIVGYILAFDL